jgi:methyl-accepting chemotaxis protein
VRDAHFCGVSSTLVFGVDLTQPIGLRFFVPKAAFGPAAVKPQVSLRGTYEKVLVKSGTLIPSARKKVLIASGAPLVEKGGNEISLGHTMFNNLRVGSRLFLLTALSSVITVIVVLFGIFGMKKITGNVEVMYNERAAALTQLGKVNSNISMIGIDIFRALQHDPASDMSKIHIDHAIALHLDAAEKLLKEIDEAWAIYTSTPLSDEEKKLVLQFNESYARFIGEVIRPAITSLHAHDFAHTTHTRFVFGFRDLGLPVNHTARSLIELNGRLAKENLEQSTEVYESSRMNMLTAFAVGLLLSTFIAWKIIRSVVAPLTDLQVAMSEIERNGDFTRRVKVSGSDEVGQTAASFNQLLITLQKALGEILNGTARLDMAATELSTTAQQAAKSSEMTSESSSAMAAAVEEMTVSVANINQNARETSDLTQHSRELSQQGSEVIGRTVAEMHAVAKAVSKSSEIITELGQQSEKISGIVQVIKDVADQTNLLALNAAIEAARAGEQGRGFAVVADEVRKLAERTTSATGEIGAMITSIQNSSQLAVGAMSNAAGRVESGVTLADEAGEAITNIQQGSEQVEAHVGDITLILAEQDNASQSIAQQVERVAQAAEENSAAARNSSVAAKNIEQLAQAMRTTVERFKV